MHGGGKNHINRVGVNKFGEKNPAKKVGGVLKGKIWKIYHTFQGFFPDLPLGNLVKKLLISK